MKYHYSINTNTDEVTIYTDFFNTQTVTREHPYYADIVSALVKDEHSKVAALLPKTAKIEKKADWSSPALKAEGAEIRDGKLFIDGREQTGRIADIATEYARKTGTIAPVKKFLELLDKNPSSQSRQEAWDFLQHKGLPIMPNGMVRGYKGVQDDYWSATGNKTTKVLRGKVNDEGRIYNGVGETIEVARNNVDDDRRRGCSHGLHVGTYEYARSFAPKLLLVEFSPTDIVSVPTDCNCQKLRCSKYTVIEEYKDVKAIPDTVTSYEPDEVFAEIEFLLGDTEAMPDYALKSAANLRTYLRNQCDKMFDELSDADFDREIERFDLHDIVEQNSATDYVIDVGARVSAYVEKKGKTTIGNIQKSLNPTKVGCSELLGLVKHLGYKVKTNGNGVSNYVVSA